MCRYCANYKLSTEFCLPSCIKTWLSMNSNVFEYWPCVTVDNRIEIAVSLNWMVGKCQVSKMQWDTQRFPWIEAEKASLWKLFTLLVKWWTYLSGYEDYALHFNYCSYMLTPADSLVLFQYESSNSQVF